MHDRVPYISFRRRAVTCATVIASLCSAFAVPVVGQVPATQPARPPATTPSTRPAVDPAKLAADRQRLADYLLGEYGKLTQSPDFVSRSIGVMLAAKFPDPRAIDFLLKSLETDKHPAVQMIAWEGLLSRSAWVSPEQHKRWLQATKFLARKGYFRSHLRKGLMEVLATGPADTASVNIASDVFAMTDSRRTEDDVTLEALGRAVAVWRSRQLADGLIARLGSFGGSEKRAVRALHAAGFPLPPPEDTEGGMAAPGGKVDVDDMRRAVEWWKKERNDWKSNGQPPAEAWRTLQSDILPNLATGAVLDPYDNRWYKDLELGKPDLSHFDVAFVIDVSGSMGPAVGWVKREIGGMMTVLGLVASEPRIGLTFFGCRGDSIGVRPTPLTSDIRKLTNTLGQVTFATGGEELVFEGLKQCIRTSRWSRGDKVAKVLVLIGDEPIASGQLPDCYALAKDAGENGFRIYAICPNRVLPEYEEICRLGNGKAFALPLRPTRGLPVPPVPATPPATAPATQPATAPATQPAEAVADSSNPAEAIVYDILSSAIRPEFRDRVAPLVRVIMALNTTPEAEPELRRR